MVVKVPRVTLVLLGCATMMAHLSQAMPSPPDCDGFLERRILDFDRDRNGERLNEGDTPSLLSDGISVTGHRRDGNQGNRSNDVVIADERLVKIHFQTSPRTNAIVINSKATEGQKGVNSIRRNNIGGSIIFNFERPIYQINEIGLKYAITRMDEETGAPLRLRPNSLLIARSTTSDERLNMTIQHPGNTFGQEITSVEPENWFNIRSLRLNTFVSVALLNLDVTFCYRKADMVAPEPRLSNPTVTDGRNNNRFGSTVAINENTLVVTSTSDSPNTNEEVHVFTRKSSDDAWIWQQNITTTSGDVHGQQKNSTVISGRQIAFGKHIAIEGNTMVINGGSRQSGKPSAFVFERLDGTSPFLLQQRLPHSFTTSSVTISNNTIVITGKFVDEVSEPDRVNNRALRTEIQLFEKSSKRKRTPWVLRATLESEMTREFSQSIDQVASINGNTLVVVNDKMRVFVRQGDGVWRQQAELDLPQSAMSPARNADVSISGNTIAFGVQQDRLSAVFVYERQQDDEGLIRWELQAELSLSNKTLPFGGSVSIDGDIIAVGATNLRRFDGIGSAYVYERDKSTVSGSSSWKRTQNLRPRAGRLGDEFGATVAVSGEEIVVGMPGIDNGYVYVFPSTG